MVFLNYFSISDIKNLTASTSQYPAQYQYKHNSKNMLRLLLISSLATLAVASHSTSSSDPGTHCGVGTYLHETDRRFLHVRPLAEPLADTLFQSSYHTSTTAHSREVPLGMTPVVKKSSDASSAAALAELPPVYYLSHHHDQRSIDTLDRLKKIVGIHHPVERHEFIQQKNSHLHWEDLPPTAPSPKIPLYWINLGDGVRRTSMEKQILDLGWTHTRRIQGIFDKNQKGGGFDALGSLVDSHTNFRDMKCAASRACTSKEVATLLSHLSAIRRAYHGEIFFVYFSLRSPPSLSPPIPHFPNI